VKPDQRERARRLYQPDLDAMKSLLPSLGAALEVAFCELSKDVSIDRIDQALMKLKGAEQSLVAMRRAKAEQGGQSRADH